MLMEQGAEEEPHVFSAAHTLAGLEAEQASSLTFFLLF